ncbi:hypothetical protein AMECASPLE_029021, partial [Ameca splendens]
VWFGHLSTVPKRTTVCRRSETAESSWPESACFCRPKQEADAAESAELEYPISNFKLTSPRLQTVRPQHSEELDSRVGGLSPTRSLRIQRSRVRYHSPEASLPRSSLLVSFQLLHASSWNLVQAAIRHRSPACPPSIRSAGCSLMDPRLPPADTHTCRSLAHSSAHL